MRFEKFASRSNSVSSHFRHDLFSLSPEGSPVFVCRANRSSSSSRDYPVSRCERRNHVPTCHCTDSHTIVLGSTSSHVPPSPFNVTIHYRILGFATEYRTSIKKFTATYVNPIARMQPCTR